MAYIGFNKKIVNGLSLRVGSRLNNKPTQAEIKAKNDKDFILKSSEQVGNIYINFLTAYNISDININNLEHLLNDDALIQYHSLINLQDKYNEIIEKLNMGKNLTATIKNEIVDIIFDMQKIVKNISTSELEIAISETEKKRKIIRNIAFALWIIAFANFFAKNFGIGFTIIMLGIPIPLFLELKLNRSSKKTYNEIFIKHYQKA